MEHRRNETPDASRTRIKNWKLLHTNRGSTLKRTDRPTESGRFTWCDVLRAREGSPFEKLKCGGRLILKMESQHSHCLFISNQWSARIDRRPQIFKTNSNRNRTDRTYRKNVHSPMCSSCDVDKHDVARTAWTNWRKCYTKVDIWKCNVFQRIKRSINKRMYSREFN